MPKKIMKTTDNSLCSEATLVGVRYIRQTVLTVEDMHTECGGIHEDESGLYHVRVVYLKERASQEPVGCLAIYDIEGEPVMGSSVCAEGDQFSYDMARDLAKKRAISRRDSKNPSMLTPNEIHLFPRELREDVAVEVGNLISDYNVWKMEK